MNLEPLLARLTAHEQQITAGAERLHEQIAELTDRLCEAEAEPEHLRITRKTLLALPDEDTPRPPAPEAHALPDHPDYQRILDTFLGAGHHLRARDLCEALDTGFEPNRIEGMRSKLKRLVKRGILDEPAPGEFRLRRP